MGRSSHHSRLAREPITLIFCPCMDPAFTALDQTIPTAPVSYSMSVKALSSRGTRLFTKLWRAHKRRRIRSSGSITSER